MTFKQGGILRANNAEWHRRQAAHAQEAIALCDRAPTDDEITKAAALLASEPSARQPEETLHDTPS